MKKSTIALLLPMMSLFSTSAFAFNVEFDPCASLSSDARAYRECRAHYGKGTEKESFKTYLCNDVNASGAYYVQVKQDDGVFKVRTSEKAPWQATQSDIVMGEKTLKAFAKSKSGELVLTTTCVLK